MTEPTTAQEALGRFLRSLRQTWDDVNVTQKILGDAIGASAALISSWEAANAIPPEDRLRQYALFFSTHRSVDSKPAALIRSNDLTAEEDREREDLIDKLVRLREEALQKPAPSRRETGALGGRFWYFPDGQPVTILCTPFSQRQIRGPGHESDDITESMAPIQQYALNPTHPNAIRNLNNGDVDALLELVGHIRAENPAIDIRWRTLDALTSANDLTGNTVILGGAEAGVGIEIVDSFRRLLDLPVDVQVGEADEEFDLQFVVIEDQDGRPTLEGNRRQYYGPRFRRDESAPGRPKTIQNGAPVLEYDLALILRRSNPLNASATLTICSGLFSRGTYGAVRAFTDANLRSRNEQYLNDLVKPADFWMLIQVPVFAGERTVTPDLGRPFHRLRSS